MKRGVSASHTKEAPGCIYFIYHQEVCKRIPFGEKATLRAGSPMLTLACREGQGGGKQRFVT